MVQYRVLGPLEVVDDQGRAVDLGRRKQRAILTALLIEANRVVSLDRLIDELWGDEPPAQATASLQAYVSNLRRELEPGRSPRQPSQTLVTRPPGYLLVVEPGDVDASRFVDLAEEGRSLIAAGRVLDGRDRLHAALSLWRGQALADFAGEEFARVEAARLEELRLVALEDRLGADIDLGSHSSAVAELESLITTHPLRERLRGLLMLALYRAGRQAEALRAFESARLTLAEEMGLDPDPALRRLHADILAQAPGLGWRSSPPARPVNGGRTDDRSPAEGTRAGLVGRQEELDRLRAELAAAAAGRGGVALIHGEAGIGKTRLAQSLADQAHGLGLGEAWGRTYEATRAPSLWPWVEVIRSLLHSYEPVVLAEAFGDQPGELAQVVPEVRALTGPAVTPPSADPATARFRLFESVLSVLRRLAGHRPLLVILDDLQWADAASLEMLSFAGPRLRDSAVLVVGTYRPVEIGRDHPLSEALAALARHQAVLRVPLSGLTESEVDALVATTTGAHAGPETVGTVHARTGGNPFFVTELARLLQSEHSLGPDAVARAVPAGVRDVVRRRLARLPDQTTALLSVAAVAGSEFDLDVLGAAAGLEAERVLELVEAALVSGLVVEAPGPVGRCRFSHALVRDTVLDELTALRRARLHARVAAALDELYGEDTEHALDLAHHSSEAGPAGRPDRAIAHLLRAARMAMGRMAPEQAYDLLVRALDLARGLPAGVERDRRELEVLRALSAQVTVTKGFAAAEILGLLERALVLCRQLNEIREMVPVLWGLTSFYNVSGQLESARPFADELLEVAERSGGAAERVAGHQCVGVTTLQQGRIDEARSHLEQALALPEGIEDPWLVSWLPQHPVVACSTFLAWALALAGDGERADEVSTAALAFARRLGHDFSTVHALLFDSWVGLWTDDAARTLRRAEEGAGLARERGFLLYAGLCGVMLGWARTAGGEAETGSAQIESGLGSMEATGARMLNSFYLALLAQAQHRAGNPRTALASIDRALDAARSSGERFYEAELRRLRGEMLAELAPDAFDRVERELLDAVELARSQGAGLLERRATLSRDRMAARSRSNT